MDDRRAPVAQSEDRPGDASREGGINSSREALGGPEETKRSKVDSPRELDDARYAALVCRAHSEQARALVQAVINLVAEHELAAGKRTNERKKKQAALSSAVERLLADLLLAQSTEKTNGYVYRPMRPESFTDGDVSYRVFKALVDALVGLGLLEHHKGFQAWGEPFGARVPVRQRATRFRATPKLLDICKEHGVRAADFHLHFLIPLPDNRCNAAPHRGATSTARRSTANLCASSPARLPSTSKGN
jgi:hypothetical protein